MDTTVREAPIRDQASAHSIMFPNGDEILFRRLDDPVVRWSKPGIRWAVEYRRYDMGPPIAQAWVLLGYAPIIEWLQVMEGHRRKGIATKLLTAVKDRWPDVEYDAVTELGEQFVDGLVEKGVISAPPCDGQERSERPASV